MNGYGEDLAFIHDAGFSGFARSAAPGVLSLLRRGGVTGGLVVDLGCGAGVWAEKLVHSGYDVLGIDVSAPMIAMARRRAPRAKFLRSSFLRAAIPSCDAVTSLGECVNYLSDARGAREPLARLFARVHEALRPGGLLILDFAGPGRGGTPIRRGYWCGDDWAILVEVEEDRRRGRLTRRMTTFRRVGRLYRRGDQIHHLRLHRRSEIATMLRRAGFDV